MNSKEFWDEMWQRKNMGREMFALAELVENVTFHQWNGHGSNPEFTEYTGLAGEKVLITMVSRFGDVGIRGRNIDVIRHGYDARVMPEKLKPIKWL